MILKYVSNKEITIDEVGVTQVRQMVSFTYSEGIGSKIIGDCMHIPVESGFKRISEDCEQGLYLNNRQIFIRTVDVEILSK